MAKNSEPGCDNQVWRENLRDPLVSRLIGPGKLFELEWEGIAGHRRQVFKGFPRNLAGLYARAMLHPVRTMIVAGERSWTYAEGFAQAAGLAASLRKDFGVGIGTKVAVVTANRPEWIVATLAVTALGGVAALVNSRGAGEEMVRAIDQGGCSLAILDAERAVSIAAKLPEPEWPRIIIGGHPVNLRPGRDAAFEDLAQAQDGVTFEPVDLPPDAGGVILFTSGTTGFPKGALLSQGAIAHSVALATTMGAVQDLRYEEETGETLPEERRAMRTPAVILGPMFHLSGIMPIFRALSLGTTIHIMAKWNTEIAFDMIENVGMTRLSFVPAMLWDILASPRATSGLLGEVRYMANGAAALDPTLLAAVRERMPNCQIANTYGQTEVAAWGCSIAGQPYLDNPDACGWPPPSVDVQIRRDDGSQADIGEPGELWIASAGNMNEYIGNAEATSQTLKDGWIATGDIGTVDERGIFRIVDRKKNMVISGGENIYCAEIERVLGEMPGIVEAIAWGEPDPRLGERVVAAAVCDDPILDAEAVLAHCRAHLALYKVPRRVMIRRDRLQRTASGKIDRGTFLRGQETE